MLGLTRNDWLKLLPVFLILGIVVTFRSSATGLIDPDEPFYALTAKEMLSRGEWMTPLLFGQPQFEKPILAYWVYVVLFKLFGVHEWSARLGPVLASLGTLAATAVLAQGLFQRRHATFYSVLILATSGLYVALSRVVLTDMFLCFFVTASLAAFSVAWRFPENKAAWYLFFGSMGLGFLTKGPIGFLLPVAGVLLYAWAASDVNLIRRIPWKSGLALFALIAFPWYGLMAARHGGDYLTHFFMHENVRRFFVAEHRSLDQPLFYPLVLLMGFFPWSGFLIASLMRHAARFKRIQTGAYSRRLFLSLFGAFAFIFFSSASSKLISYIFPVFPALAVLAGEWLDRVLRSRAMGGRPLTRSIHVLFFIGWGVLPAALVGGFLAYEKAHHLGLWNPSLAAGLVCVTGCLAAYIILLKEQIARAVLMAAGTAALFAGLVFAWVMPMIEPFFSSRKIMSLFVHDGFNPLEGTLIASKMTVRGISFYSGNSNVAVVTSNPGKTFYTPHPLLMVSSQEDIGKISQEHYPVYGILRPKEIRRLREIMGSEYDLKVLDANSQASIVRLDRRAV